MNKYSTWTRGMFAIVLPLLLLLTSSETLAQFRLRSAAIGALGGTASAPGTRLRAVAGQPHPIGTSSNTGFILKPGFISTTLATQTRKDPPFSGTIFIDPDIITSADPTSFQGVTYIGQAPRRMFDRRVNGFINVNAFLFNAAYDDGLTAEIQVNPEFGDANAAQVEAQKYGEVIGRLPNVLRRDVQTVWIHKGIQPFGGGNNNLLIHTGQADLYQADGILEETLVHEGAHTSLDADHAAAPGWLAAQAADPTFISTYARDNPNREDIAESFLPYIAVRYRLDRISQELAGTILQTIPKRLDYFDSQSFDMYPITPRDQVLTWQAGLTVRDAGNNSRTLNFGRGPGFTNDIDPGSGEEDLPPTPPTGVFAARFELPVTPPKASYKDYRSDSEQATTWRMKFQPGATAGPITFSWSSAGFPSGSLSLKDEITGTLVNVNMKAQNTYTLTNTAITTLKIEYSREVSRDVNVSSAWNILSIPVAAANMAVSSLFPDAASQAFEYNNGYVSAATLANGKGYWLKFNAAKSYPISGVPVATREIQVRAGWNMIGAFENDAAASAITSVPAGIVGSQYFGYNNGYTPATTLSPGKGYWVKANQAGVLQLPSGSAPAMAGKAATVDNEVDGTWPKLVIEDQAGNVATLYLAPESNGSFELPPIPPAGIFDARFSSGQYVESLDGAREIHLSSAQYPLRLTAHNLGERVINIKDLLGGNVLNATLTQDRAITVAKSLEKIVVTASQLPRQFALSQNYPNPFNPQTAIKFALPKKAHVKIAVFNLLGAKVAELVNQEMEAGYHQLQFDGHGFASGLYFYVMQAGDFKDMKKMIIAK